MSKNGQNEGSIYQRKDGSWSSQVSIEGRRLTKYFKTRKEANEWRQEILRQKKNGLSLAGATAQMSEFLANWLATAKTSVRIKTYQQYEQVVRIHILPTVGRIKLEAITPNVIQALYNKKQHQNASVRTVRLIHSVLHRALHQAVMWQLIGWNPADAVVQPKLVRKEMKVLSDTQVRNLLLASKGTRYEALFQIAVTTGLREGEILGLKWSDVDWKSKQIQVVRQAQRINKVGLVFSEPKSAAGRRCIQLGVSMMDKLREHMELQNLERQFQGDKWIENDLIFPSTIGTLKDPRNLIKVFKQYLKKAGLPEIRFHDLRHTAATLMLQMGTHPKIVQERLGHSDISLTLNTYSHVMPSMQEEVATKMDEMLTLIDVHEEVIK